MISRIAATKAYIEVFDATEDKLLRKSFMLIALVVPHHPSIDTSSPDRFYTFRVQEALALP